MPRLAEATPLRSGDRRRGHARSAPRSPGSGVRDLAADRIVAVRLDRPADLRTPRRRGRLGAGTLGPLDLHVGQPELAEPVLQLLLGLAQATLEAADQAAQGVDGQAGLGSSGGCWDR